MFATFRPGSSQNIMSIASVENQQTVVVVVRNNVNWREHKEKYAILTKTWRLPRSIQNTAGILSNEGDKPISAIHLQVSHEPLLQCQQGSDCYGSHLSKRAVGVLGRATENIVGGCEQRTHAISCCLGCQTGSTPVPAPCPGGCESTHKNPGKPLTRTCSVLRSLPSSGDTRKHAIFANSEK